MSTSPMHSVKQMKNVQTMSFSQETPKQEPWLRIGTAFEAKNGEGFNVLIGNKIPKEQGSKEMVEQVKEVTLVPNSQLYIAPATNKDKQLVKTKAGKQVYRVLLKPFQEIAETK